MSAESFLSDADRLASEGRNGESAIHLALALEMTLASCVSSVLMRRPSQQKPTLAEVQMLRKRYMAAVAGLPLRSLRNFAIHLCVRRARPATIAEALDIIEQAKRLASRLPPPEQFASIDDAEMRSAIEGLRDTTLLDLRDAVVHQGYEPTAGEIQAEREAVAIVIRALQNVFAG